MSSRTRKNWKRWTRFRLRTLTIWAVGLVAILAILGPQIRRASIQSQLKATSTTLVYDYEMEWYYGVAGSPKDPPSPPWPTWMMNIFGKDLLCSARAVIGFHSRDFLPLVASLPDVEAFSAVKCDIRDEDLHYLLELRQLRSLELEQNQITDEGLRTIGKMVTLKYLNISSQVFPRTGGHPITDRGLKHLVPLDKLRALGVHATGITAEGVEAFASAHPNCKVARTDEELRLVDGFDP